MTLEHAQAALKKFFGYDAFRHLQAEVIQAVYEGRDVPEYNRTYEREPPGKSAAFSC